MGGAAWAGEHEHEKQLWLEPAWGALLPVVGLASSGPLPGTVLYVPVGMNVPLGERSALGVELSYLHRRWMPTEEGTTLDHRADAVRVSVGPVFQLSGERPYEGFFVQPLVTAMFVYKYEETLLHEGGRNVVDRWGMSTVVFEAGLDVGYGFRWGNFTLTPLIGASVGYSPLALLGTGPDWLWIARGQPGEANRGVAWNLNLDLLRLGWVF
ncbi:hypothetical protein [Archangium sp.]|uniref:hypothetical protein n=1 Tax=Archangium sp. TaxID=1872627 RepID=UPI003899C6FA